MFFLNYYNAIFISLKDKNNVGVNINVMGKGEHTKLIERYHRVFKERARCYCAMLPFDSFLCVIVVHLLITIIFYINKPVNNFLINTPI